MDVRPGGSVEVWDGIGFGPYIAHWRMQLDSPPVRSWLDRRVEIRPSPIHGLGMFAREPIRAGDVVVRWGGKVMPLAELDKLKMCDRYDCSALSEDTIIVFAPDDPVIHGNHSCDATLWLEDALTLTARRDIAAGEEITVDYAILSDDPEWTEPCRCGSPLCRGVMRGDDWRQSEVQERYRGHFAPYLNQRIAAANHSHEEERPALFSPLGYRPCRVGDFQLADHRCGAE